MGDIDDDIKKIIESQKKLISNYEQEVDIDRLEALFNKKFENYVQKHKVSQAKKKRKLLVLATLSLIAVSFLSIYLYTLLYPAAEKYSAKDNIVTVPFGDAKVTLNKKSVISIEQIENKQVLQLEHGQIYVENATKNPLYIVTPNGVIMFSGKDIEILSMEDYERISTVSGLSLFAVKGDTSLIGSGDEIRYTQGQKSVQKLTMPQNRRGAFQRGLIYFENEPLPFAIRYLAESYAIVITSEAELNDIMVSGIFNREQDPLEVLRALIPDYLDVKAINDTTFKIEPLNTLEKQK